MEPEIKKKVPKVIFLGATCSKIRLNGNLVLTTQAIRPTNAPMYKNTAVMV